MFEYIENLGINESMSKSRKKTPPLQITSTGLDSTAVSPRDLGCARAKFQVCKFALFISVHFNCAYKCAKLS